MHSCTDKFRRQLVLKLVVIHQTTYSFFDKFQIKSIVGLEETSEGDLNHPIIHNRCLSSLVQ